MSGMGSAPGTQKNLKRSRTSTDGYLPAAGSTQAKLTQFFKPLHSFPSLKDRTNAILSDSPDNRSPASKKPNRSVKESSAVKEKDTRYQPVIDANQRRIGPQVCSECGCCLDYDDLNDRKLHDVHHAHFLRDKMECERTDISYTSFDLKDCVSVLGLPEDFKMFVITTGRQSANLKKTQAILKVVLLEVYAVHQQHFLVESDIVLLLLNVRNKSVVACLAAENVPSTKTSILPVAESPIPADGAPVHTPSQKALCGIYLLWVSPLHRRKKIATMLTDYLRMQYFRICFNHGQIINKGMLAFSDPASHGTAFILAYMGGIACQTYVHARPSVL